MVIGLRQGIAMSIILWFHLLNACGMDRVRVGLEHIRLELVGRTAFLLAVDVIFGITSYFGISSNRMDFYQMCCL
jgi:hypothetical protein